MENIDKENILESNNEIDLENDKKGNEKNCMLCGKKSSEVNNMFSMPGGIDICEACMQKGLDTVAASGKLGDINKNSNVSMDLSNLDLSKFNLPKGSLGDIGIAGIRISKDDLEKTEDGKIDLSRIDLSKLNFAPIENLLGLNNVNKKVEKKEKKKPKLNKEKLYAPHELKKLLDEYVIGQDRAKKILSVAVYNHYKRIMLEEKKEETGVSIEKSNILMLGPTGSGKTYMVKTLAKILDVPLAITDATSLTESGYIGDDIESVVSKLLSAAGGDVEKAQAGIIFIDEIDKIAKKNSTRNRDVSGESVQQELLKLLEGSDIEVPISGNQKNPLTPMVTVNTDHILFICGGAFPDLENIIKERLSNKSGMGFNAVLKDELNSETDLFLKVDMEDIRKFGMIPEFLGRLPILLSMSKLDEKALVRVLKEPKNAILKQYEKLFEYDEVKLEFEEEALESICKLAIKKGTGARALRSIIEEFMLDIMYEVPKDDNISKVIITKNYIENNAAPVVQFRS